MADPILIKTGQHKLDVLPKAAKATDFEIKFKINCKSEDVSYVSVPATFSFNEVSGKDLIGYVGLIYDNTLDNSTYFVVGSIDRYATDWFKFSNKAALNLDYKSGTHDVSIYLFDAAIPQWDENNLDLQIQTYGVSLGGLKETVFSNTAAGLQFSGEDSINYEKFTPYLITLDRDSKIITPANVQKLKSQGVIGAVIEAGYLYDVFHRERATYANPNLKRQVEIFNLVKLPYGLFATSRARSVFEAKKELEPLSTIIRAYPPKLGMWLKFSLSKYVSINNNIINEYYKQFVELGLMDQIGLYTTAFNLKQITWDKHQQWYLWLIDHVSTFTDLDQLLTPQFFKLN